MKIIYISFILSFCTLFLINCASHKHNIKYKKNDIIDFYSNEFGLVTKGKMKIKVTYNTVIVNIIEGSIVINPKAKKEKYSIGDIYASLGKVIDLKKGSWTTSHHSRKKTIEMNLNSKLDSIDISNYKFTIPYYNNEFPKKTWIVFSINDSSRKGWVFSHSDFINYILAE